MTRKAPVKRPSVKTETPLERRTRMVAHAAMMRMKQVEKRTTQHVCTPSPIDTQLTYLQDTLKRVAPANIASTPIMLDFEWGVWTVSVCVRIKGVTDYDVEGHSESLANALANATETLSDQEGNEQRSDYNAARYGYQV